MPPVRRLSWREWGACGTWPPLRATALDRAGTAARLRGASVELVPERLAEGALLLRRHDVDALPAADLLAQLAADARLLVDLDLAEVLRLVVRRRVDAVEGADIDADAAAVAVVRVDDRDRPLLALQDLGDVAVRVED